MKLKDGSSTGCRQAGTRRVTCKLPWVLPTPVCLIIKTSVGMREKKSDYHVSVCTNATCWHTVSLSPFALLTCVLLILLTFLFPLLVKKIDRDTDNNFGPTLVHIIDPYGDIGHGWLIIKSLNC